MKSIHDQILDKLDAVEREHDIRIPLAVESGSRAWGFASMDSDYDCRFVYVRPKREYLTVFSRKDTIGYEPDPVFDLDGWDIKKFIEHLTKSNAVMLEWLQSGMVYRRDEAVRQALWELAKVYFCPVKTTWHYLSMARKKMEEIKRSESAKLKKYFYVLRPLACIRFIREKGGIPFMEYKKNLAAIEVREDIRVQIDGLLRLKEEAEETRMVTRNDAMLAYFMHESALAQEWLMRDRRAQANDMESANRCFRRILEICHES